MSNWTGPLSEVPVKLDVDGPHVAYSIGSPTETNQFATEVLIRDVASGALVRTVATDRVVWDLALSGDDLAYILEDIDILNDNRVSNLELMVSSENDTEPRVVAQHASRLSFDGDLLVWDEFSRDDDTDSLTHDRVLGARQPSLEPFLVSREGRGSYLSVAGDDTVAWTELGFEGAADLLVSIGLSDPVSVATADVAFLTSLGGGWLVWEVYGEVEPGYTSFGMFAVPLSAIHP